MALTGTLDDLNSAELLQMLNLNRKSGTLMIRSGRREATVHVRDGEIVHAVIGDVQGAEAVYRLLALVSGEFEFARCTDAMPRTITSSTESLILEGARRWDEWSRLERQISEMNQILRIRVGAVDVIPTLETAARTILDLVDARRDVATIVRESGIEPEEALRTVRALIADKVVEPWTAATSSVGERVHVDPAMERGDLAIVVGVNNAHRRPRAGREPSPPEDAEPNAAEALLSG